MSKSKDNIASQEALEATLSRSEKMAAEDAKHARTTKLYGFAVLLLLIAAIGAVVWNTGNIQQGATAATVGDQKISVAEMNYYYNTMLSNEMQSAASGTSGFDTNQSAKQQMYDADRTYHDYFMESALAEIQSVYAINSDAAAQGYAVDQEAIDADWDSAKASIEQYALTNGMSSAQEYLQYNYGSHATMDTFEKVFRDQSLAAAYVTDKTEEFIPDETQVDDYYTENTADLDSYTIDYMVLLANTPTAAEGETLTDDQKAAGLEENRVAMEQDAKEILAALEAGGDFAQLGEDYDTYGTYQGDQYMGLYLNTSFADWVKEDGRQAGDTTVALYEGSDRYVYYVVRYQDRARDDSPTASIRHIYVSAGYDPTQEEYDEAYETASEMLDQWKDGEATADSFGQLAYYYSADTGSAQNGGLITAVSHNSGYVDTFTDWCLDESRQPGDTELVINEGSDQKGWHIMYFQEKTDPQWSLVAQAIIGTEQMENWHTQLMDTNPAQLESGTKYVG